MKRSLIDVAFELLQKKKKPVPFIKLWSEVAQIEGLTQAQQDDRIAQFYSDMCLDNRFANMGENKWDLRSRHTFSEVVINTDDLLDDSDDEEENYELDENEDEEEEKDDDKY